MGADMLAAETDADPFDERRRHVAGAAEQTANRRIPTPRSLAARSAIFRS